MGHQTVKHVPRITSYADALAAYNNIKPIRGRSPEVRPLGQRRDHQYYVRKNGENVECVLYRTPVVVFRPDNTVVIRTDGWCSVSTHQFIYQVMGLDARGFSGKTQITFPDGYIHLLGGSEELVVVRGATSGRWEPQTKHEKCGYKFNRVAANNVRKRHKEFADYCNSMIKLRQEPGTNAIPLEPTELVTVLGEKPPGVGVRGATYDFEFCLDRLGAITQRDTRKLQEQHFVQAISSEQPEDVKHMNFYKAFLALALGQRIVWREQYMQTLKFTADAFKKHYDKALMMAHANEVLELTKLAEDELPNRKYHGWI